MSSGRHASGQSRTPVVLITGAVSAAAGVVLLAVAAGELLRYSPYENPGAGQVGLWLGLTGLAMSGVPVLALAARLLAGLHRQYRAWKAALTPGHRAALAWGESAAALGLHWYLRERNRETSAELTRKVMGEEQ